MRVQLNRRPLRVAGWLAIASVMLLLQACGGNNNNFNSHSTRGNSGSIPVSNTQFSGTILFVKGGNLFILHGKDDSLTQLTADGSAFQPSVSPDGSTIAFELRAPGKDYSDLATLPLTGGSVTIHTDDSMHFRSPGTADDSHNHYQFWAGNPIWTSDGQRIIYLSDFFKGGEDTNPANQTCLNISDGPRATWILDMGIVELPANARPVAGGQLRDPPKQLAWPYCAAGGDQDLSLRPGVSDTELLFTSFRYTNQGSLAAQISVLIIPNKGGPERIIQLSPEDPNNIPLEPSWSPDGRYITYIRRENGQDNLYIMPVDATLQTGTPTTFNGGPEVYRLVGGGSTSYSTNTTYYAASQKLADGIIGQPIWGEQHQLFFIKFQNNAFDLFLAKVKFSAPAPGAATPTTAPAPTMTLDGSPIQLTQNGIDGGSRPVWLSA